MKKQTLGKTILELQAQNQNEANVGDILPLEEQRYIKALFNAVDRGKSRFDTDFFIEVNLKKEKLMKNVLPRIYAVDRRSCPTPFYNQDCFKYRRIGDEFVHVWSIPGPDDCNELMNAVMDNQLDEEYREIAESVIRFRNGSLMRLCKKLNGEKSDDEEMNNLINSEIKL